MTKSREGYYRQYYRKQAMDSLRNSNKNLQAKIKTFEESPEGIAYKQRLTQEYAKQYRIDNQEKLRAYQKNYMLSY
tara:strand:+ start:288 stop:515 length:228 start_codon:yes stop_codon:yes gene_type:complete